MRIEFTADDHSFDLNFKEAVYIKGEDGKNLEFLWNGTKLGVRQEGQTEYQFVELKGETGEQGETGNGIDHITLNPDYTLTVYYTDGTEYVTAPIRGAKGDKGDKGDTGEQGPQGIQGIQGPAGQNGADGEDGITPTIGENGNWYLGDTDTGKPSRGVQGEQGIQGIPGADGQDGYSPTASVSKSGKIATITITDESGTTTATVSDGENGADGAPGADGADGADGATWYTGNDYPTDAKSGDYWLYTGNTIHPDGYSIGDVSRYDGTAWEVEGNIRGAQGIQGIPGQDGAAGQDGVSPTVTITDTATGHNVTITDKDHPGGQTFAVTDGEDGAPGADGADGVSPTITSTAITGGHRLTITDVDGTRTVDVLDGENGADGTDGEDGKSIYAGSAVPTTDGYNIGDLFVLLTNGQVYVLDDEPLLRWKDTGYTIKGAQGAAGKSAYESAQDGGYTGTETQFNSDLADVGGKYTKPSSGIPASDLASGVIPTVPTQLSQLTDDSTHRTVTDTEKAAWDAKYAKPSTGIPASDIALGVLPTFKEDPNGNVFMINNMSISANYDGEMNDIVTRYATKAEMNGKYTKPSSGIPASDLANGVIPNTLSQLSGDSTHRTVTDSEKETWSGKQDEAKTQTVTIAVSDWSGGTTVTKSVTGVTATSIVIVDTSDSNVECTGQGNGTLTFTATSTPTSAVTAKVVIL